MKKLPIKVKPMDVVLTASRFPPIWECLKRHATAGWKNTFNKRISTHAGFVVDFQGHKMIAELKWPRGRIVSFSKYLTGRRLRPRIVALKRFKEYRDRDLREYANIRTCIDCLNFEYDIPGLLEFYNLCRDVPHKYYCSEFVYYETCNDLIIWRKKFQKKIGPYDIEIENNSELIWHE